MSVFDLSKGEIGIVISVLTGGAAGERLSALGIVSGAEVCCLSFSMFKGSILLSVQGNRVALRKCVAQQIEVQRLCGAKS